MPFSNDIKINLKSQYTENIIRDFYEPLLSEANLYQRVSGYFSTTGLDLYANGLEELAKNGGRVEFIISKKISQQDFDNIQNGYELKKELKTLKLAERNSRLNEDTQQQLGNLAFMIANGRARVKIALVKQGIFHDKFGIITSGDERVFFNGSANETYNGLNQNYESISVDKSWDESQSVQERINENIGRFNRLWNNQEDNVKVIEASELAYDEIAQYQEQKTIDNIDMIEDDSHSVTIPPETIAFQLYGNQIVRIDNTSKKLTMTDRQLSPESDIAELFEEDNTSVLATTTYKDIERIINVTKRRAARADIKVSVSQAVEEFIARNKYSIEQYRILGEVYRGDFNKFPEVKKIGFEEFVETVQSEVARPLKYLHLRAAYYEYEMARAGNFSVPGSGKTAMILGTFAYLNRENSSEKVNRLLVVSPINAFDSWKREFRSVFGEKKELKVIDSQQSNFNNLLNTDWGISNLVLINYESLGSYTNQLKHLIGMDTMLVFDEVHRIKNPDGQRAQAALEISQLPKFRYVLTGTPIPNTYRDIYNFLHILYGNEYESFFGWDPDELKDPSIRQIENINETLHPFFWRTNKQDLNVPPADKDNVITVKPSPEQQQLAEAIYYNESSSFAILIRLIQASTNPSLVNSNISYDDFNYGDGDVNNISEKDFNDLLDNQQLNMKSYANFDVNQMISPKFSEGIELVSKLVSEGKKVLVWGIFVDTIMRIATTLHDKGIKTNLVYGKTEKNERVQLIDDFRDGDVQVLVSNPNTLAESISLHQTVHDAVYFEYDFNLTYMLQSRDRIHRLGLSENQYTRYYYLQTEGEDVFSDRPGYIDQKIYQRLTEKEQIMYSAIDDDTLSMEYSPNEIQEAIEIINKERKRIKRE